MILNGLARFACSHIAKISWNTCSFLPNRKFLFFNQWIGIGSLAKNRFWKIILKKATIYFMKNKRIETSKLEKMTKLNMYKVWIWFHDFKQLLFFVLLYHTSFITLYSMSFYLVNASKVVCAKFIWGTYCCHLNQQYSNFKKKFSWQGKCIFFHI